MTQHTIGVDISKDQLDIHVLPGGDAMTVTNSGHGFRKLVRWFRKLDPQIIVFEPTGSYHRAFEQAMHTAGFAICKVNPLYARRFAQAVGVLAKTDRVDAALLARMGVALDPEPQQPQSETAILLRELAMSRRGLMKERTATLNRQKTLIHPLLKRQCAARLRQIEGQVKQLDAEIGEVIRADEHLCRRATILTSIPGISDVTAFTLMVEMPELGTLSSPQIASLAGLAPMTRESGKWKGKSFIQGGRAILRQSMYMPALVATRFNPDMRVFYERLVAAGKPAKVAITAVMRKLVILANALVKADRTWEPRTSS
ncbi:transposase [uncultured Tateyamaria sp.]|uniref:transposase n=1 Tax=uncultured Tateyamaria sp. TaxID=455651 RepID=UPI0026219D53|nr:transposase [uncultured Tateyamaria sp.]